MDVFEIREGPVPDYRAFTAAFVELRDGRIAIASDVQRARGAVRMWR